jgi:hypothetical protein
LTVGNCTLTENSAGNGGGGINNSSGTVTITSSTLAGNSAANGGGICSFSSTVTVTNSTLSGNTAMQLGGAFCHVDGQATFVNATLTNNRANADSAGPTFHVGGGIYALDFPDTFTTLHNSLVAGNFSGIGTTPSDIEGRNVEVTSSFNLIGDANTAGGLTGGVNGNRFGIEVARVLNPVLANNGGPTMTHALIAGSPAVNAGSDANIPSGITTDQRGAGYSRILLGTVDIGAVEFLPPAGPYVVDLSNDEHDGNYTMGDLSLREAILLANDNPGADAITFAPSVMTVTLTIDTLVLSDEAPTTITGNGVIVERSNAAPEFIIFGIDTGAHAALWGLTIRNGRYSVGAGIYNLGMLSVTNSTLSGNSAADMWGGGRGGGIYNRGVLTVANSTIFGNSAGSFGGGILNDGTLDVVNSIFSGNSADISGGGIDNVAGSLTVTNSTFSGNYAGNFGSAIENSGATAIVIYSTVVNNRANSDDDHSGGGALDNFFGTFVIPPYSRYLQKTGRTIA